METEAEEVRVAEVERRRNKMRGKREKERKE